MANKTFMVFFNKTLCPGQVGEGTNTVESKANAEKYAKGGKEPWVVTGPVIQWKAVEINAENKEAVAVCARQKLGVVDSEGELTTVEVANLEKVSDKI